MGLVHPEKQDQVEGYKNLLRLESLAGHERLQTVSMPVRVQAQP
jgi:hypothetical protein